jgi:membrane protein
VLRRLRVPVGWGTLLRRSLNETIADDLLGLSAELAYYFFFALFPALLVLISILSYVPVHHVMDAIMATLGRIAPGDVMSILRGQVSRIAGSSQTGLLTLGIVGALWTMSSALTAIVDALNRTYDIQESRSWWKVRLLAIGLILALSLFIIASTVIVLAGPALADYAAGWIGFGRGLMLLWWIVQWPLAFAFVSFAVAVIYYYAPDAEQEWIWITPGSVAATTIWIVVSLGLRYYVANFGSYNATYGAIGGIIVLLLWFYVSAFAVLLGAELNAELEHASPYGKNPGEKVARQKVPTGSSAEAAVREEEDARQRAEAVAAAAAREPNCDIDAGLPSVSLERKNCRDDNRRSWCDPQPEHM